MAVRGISSETMFKALDGKSWSFPMKISELLFGGEQAKVYGEFICKIF
jgi:hypothetical protein